jgi:hypothetical protein
MFPLNRVESSGHPLANERRRYCLLAHHKTYRFVGREILPIKDNGAGRDGA